MTLSPISVIEISDIISILNAYETFNEKDESDKLDFIAAVQQDTCNLYNNAGKSDYLLNNYTDPLSPAVGPAYGIRSGEGVASIAGTLIEFKVGGIATPLSSIPNIHLPLGISYVNPDTDVDTRTINGFTAYAQEDDIPFIYTAVELT